ncbi:MAG TPA: tyrosine-type recombinase/integrase, partial [Thermoleophilia bacterium]|nr:tyrosine-type recombinase/integrase [Thermoleophilia bacterium]
MTAIAPHVTAFLRERLPKQRAASQHTCDTYAYALKLLFEYAGGRLKLTPSSLAVEQLDATLILGFLDHLERDRGNSPSTRNARLAAIKSFMKFLEHRETALLDQVHRVMAIPAKRTDQKLVGYLTTTEVEAVLNVPSPETRIGLRDRAMIHLCYGAGLRVTELVTLPLAAVTLHAEPAVRVIGKGRRERCLPLWKQVVADVRAWVKVRGDVPASELFVNARGGPMTRAGFEYVLHQHVAAAAAGCPSLIAKSVTPHVLRHTCAMTILQATGDLRKVSLWLGHADMKTTQIYLRADP